jgi:hypothetical protein
MEKRSIHYFGVYNIETLKFLKNEKANSFGFDFNPRSLNFIQEYLFLEIFEKYLAPKDEIFLYFENNRDPMIIKLFGDLKNTGKDLSNIFFVFNQYDLNAKKFDLAPFYIKYALDKNFSGLNDGGLIGIIVDFELFDQALNKGELNQLCRNITYSYPEFINSKFKIVLSVNWSDNVFTSIFEYFDIDLIKLNLSREVEVSYRTIDFNKLKNEVQIKNRYLQF